MSGYKSYINSILVFFLSLLLNTTIQACEKTFQVSAADNWPPYSYKQDEIYKGLDIDIIELILKKADFCWEYLYLSSSARAILELKKGNIDLIFAASFTAQRNEFADFSLPYREEIMQLFTHTKNTNKPQLADRYTFAINRGVFYGSQFREFQAKCLQCIVGTNLATERFGLLKFRRVDFAVEDMLTGSYLIKNKELSSFIKNTNFIVHRNPIHLMLKKNLLNKQEFNKLNLAIEKSLPEINKLVNAYSTDFDIKH
jgi:polar amino acid transport system substrate-binding protein